MTTAVFVHGGWHDGWSWHLVRELLDTRGIPSVALDLPMTTLDRDAAVLSAALAAVVGDAIVDHLRGVRGGPHAPSRYPARNGGRGERGGPRVAL